MVGAALLTLVLAQAQEPNVVVATGSATTTLQAEVANVSFAARAFDADPAAALASSKAAIAKARATVSGALPGVKIGETETPEPQPEYATLPFAEEGGTGAGLGAAAPKIKGYNAESGFKVDGLSFGQADRLTEILSREGGQVAAVVGYGLKDPAAARRAVLRAAFLDARGKAAEAASAAGLQIGDVVLLEPGDGPVLTPQFESNYSLPNVPGYRAWPVKRIVAAAEVKVRFRLVKAD